MELLYYLSTFCLMPPGDSASRKGLFDAILMGCIPVVFYPESTYYPWYWPAGFGPFGFQSFTVYVPGRRVLEYPKSSLNEVSGMPAYKVKSKQKQLASIASRVQYASGNMGVHERSTIGPDALEYMLAGLRVARDAHIRARIDKRV